MWGKIGGLFLHDKKHLSILGAPLPQSPFARKWRMHFSPSANVPMNDKVSPVHQLYDEVSV